MVAAGYPIDLSDHNSHVALYRAGENANGDYWRVRGPVHRLRCCSFPALSLCSGTAT
jgi:hypothetical protein